MNNEAAVTEYQVSSQIDVIARRELALRAVDAIAEVLEVEVSVPNLIILAGDAEPTPVRLAAKRALRCIEAIGTPDSPVIRAIGEVGIYHYAEAVVDYGANEQTFLDLMAEHGLTAEQTTGLYEVRRLVAEETNGQIQGFPTLVKALRSVGIGAQQAAFDPIEAVAALSEAGYFVDHAGRVNFNRPIFAPSLARVPLGTDIDDTKAPTDAVAWLREQLGDLAPEEIED